MTAVFEGRFRPHGACGMSIDRSGRCEIGLGAFILDLSDDQARMLRNGLVALYGLPAEHRLVQREAVKPARRMALDALPAEAHVVLGLLDDEWADDDTLQRRSSLSLRHEGLLRALLRDEGLLRALLAQLVNAGLAERRKVPTGARRRPTTHWRRKPSG